LDFLRGNRHLAAAAKAALAARTANSRFEDPANKGNCPTDCLMRFAARTGRTARPASPGRDDR
jgi:hypothetical protein